MTERLHFHFSLSCIGEGNGNPFQCSCLENPGDGGTWWAAVYGVVQSRTRLMQLSSSSTITASHLQIRTDGETDKDLLSSSPKLVSGRAGRAQASWLQSHYSLC